MSADVRPKTRIPRLHHGQRLTRAEFMRRWEAMPELKRTERIEGKVGLVKTPPQPLLEAGRGLMGGSGEVRLPFPRFGGRGRGMGVPTEMQEFQNDDSTPRNVIVGAKVSDEKKALARALRKSMTPAESVLWNRLRRNQLDGLHVRRQQPIRGYIADFCCHALRLIVEVDGPVHESQQQEDAARDEIFRAFGFRILRVKNEDVFERLNQVLGLIRSFRGLEDPSPTPPRSGEGL